MSAEAVLARFSPPVLQLPERSRPSLRTCRAPYLPRLRSQESDSSAAQSTVRKSHRSCEGLMAGTETYVGHDRRA